MAIIEAVNTTCEELISRIETRQARVGVIGLGYVGLPLALIFEESGFAVVGFDVDPEKVRKLEIGETYIRHIGAERVAKAFRTGKIVATSDFDDVRSCDAIIICVPTPLGEHREPDLSFVKITADEVAKRLRPGQLIVLESTTYPGTTREILLPRLEESGLSCGEDFFLAFSPEREDPGNLSHSTKNIPKVLGAIDENSKRSAVALYSAAIDEVVPVESAEVAEAAKLLENIFRAVNIALVNELKIVLDRMGINIWSVIEAAKTKPFGFMPFYPGPGLGGHCIPLDPFYLSWKAAEYGVWARFIELAGEINTGMPRYVVEKTVLALNEHSKSVKGSRILVLGLSYKPDIDDHRESPSFELIELLEDLGASVSYCDPYVQTVGTKRDYDIDMSSVPCTPEEFSRYDALIVSTSHMHFKDPSLYEHVPIVVDSRNILTPDQYSGLLVRA